MTGKTRFKAIPAVHLFLMKGNHVLLARRFNTGYEDGKFSVTAGHVDGGEPVKQAMVREAGEEVGVLITPEDLEMAHVMHRLSQGEERIDFFFIARKWAGEPRITEPDKCDQLLWSEITKLPENVILYVRAALNAITQGENYSEFGWE